MINLRISSSACTNSRCLKRANSIDMCIRCNLSRYCSQECMEIDWKTSHQYNCNQDSRPSLRDFVEVSNPDLRLLGKGSYGEVKLIQHQTNKQFFALKQISKETLKRHSSVLILLREINIHKSLRHPNIIQLHHHFENDQNVYLVLDYAAKGSLFKVIRHHNGLAEHLAWHYFTQTCIGLKYLHERQIIHRDLKPENILIDQFDDVKICDFGWCVQSCETRNTFCGTLDYMAPEMVLNKGHSFQVDLWAIGVLLFELLHGFAPFRALMDKEKCKQIVASKLEFGDHISEEAKDLIKKLIMANPEDRLGLNGVLRHQWIKKFITENDLNLNQEVKHYEYQEGYVNEIDGLLCGIFYPKFNYTQFVAIPDIKNVVDLVDIGFVKNQVKKEEILMEKLQNWISKPSKRKKRRKSAIYQTGPVIENRVAQSTGEMIGTLNVINDPEENSQADFIIKTKPKTESKMNLKKHSEVNFENSVNTPIRSVFRSEYSDQNKPKECGNLKTIHNSRTTTEIAPRGSIRKIDFENLSQQQMPRGSTKRSEIQSTLQSKPPRPSPKPDVRSKEISLDASPDSVVISITEDKPRGLFNYPIEIDNFETDRNSKVLKIKQQSKSKIDTNISRKAHTIDALSFKISQNDTDLSSKALKDKEDELMRLYKSIASEKPKHEERRTVQTPQYSVILKEKRPEKSWFSNLFGCVERN